jgi:hypothetical protein
MAGISSQFASERGQGNCRGRCSLRSLAAKQYGWKQFLAHQAIFLLAIGLCVSSSAALRKSAIF